MFSRAVKALVHHLAAFRISRRGQVAITFGIAAMPALIMIGCAIDYTRAVTYRSNLQQATDSTVLAIAHNYLSSAATCASLYPATQQYLTGTMNTPAAASMSPSSIVAACNQSGITGASGAATLQYITIAQNNTVMCIYTTMSVPTVMMTIVNIKTMSVGAHACSQVGGTYEVALVMDNSYSMNDSAGSGSKMQAAQQAAIGLVQTMIPTGTVSPNTAISLTPFNALVNVNYQNTSTGPAFMDTTGASSLNWINPATASRETPRAAMYAPNWINSPSKFSLFSTLKRSDGSALPWSGCVEERPNNVNFVQGKDNTNWMTTDLPATNANPDSLFVPYFAPDDPGNINSTFYGSSFYGFSCETFGGGASCPNAGYKTFLNSYLNDSGATIGGQCTAIDVANDKVYPNPNGSLCIGNTCVPTTYPSSGMTMACRYKSASTNVSPQTNNGAAQWFGLDVSPNSNCTTPAITPLTTNQTTLVNAINAMTPTGLTNLGTGFMWGWRTISGLTTPFFPWGSNTVTTPAPIGPKNPVPYTYKGPPSNTKVIILMTDGENSWAPYILSDNNNLNVVNPFLSSYEAFGFMTQNRLANYSTTCSNSSAALTGSGFVTNATLTSNVNGNWPAYRCQMDNMLLEACTNAKNAGIVIYTVGFAVSGDPIDAEGQAVLQNCATSPANAYIASNSSDIVVKFQQIAASITNLRISQ